MHDQAHHLRNLVRAAVAADATLAPGGPIVVLTGAQPRVGVTTTACGLARELTRLGKQVVLVDANLKSPQVAAHLKHETAAGSTILRGTLADILTGARRASEVLIATGDEGPRYIPGCPSGANPPLNAAAADRIAAELSTLARQFDVILIDAGHGMSAWVDRLWQLAVEVLIVAGPTGQGLVDAYTAAKVSQYQHHDNKLRLVLAGGDDQATSLAGRFAETCDQFLSLKTKPAATVPAPLPTHSPQRQQGSLGASGASAEAHTRALRLLAADLTAEFRATSLRLIRPNRVSLHTASANSDFLTQRR